MQFIRRWVGRLAVATGLTVACLLPLAPAQAETVTVQGNHRVDAATIRTYFEGEAKGNTSQIIKDLYASGLFADVKVTQGRGGLVVTVVENGAINRVAFEGNTKVKGDQLGQEIQTKSRGAYSAGTVQADIERIKEVYRRQGRGSANVTARTVDLPNGKIDVVFTVEEGDKTGVKSIEFEGNKAYGSGRLRGLMQTTESNLLSFIKTSDVYDPDKIATDEDLIRRFYLRNGYADFRIVASEATFDPADGGYKVLIKVEEGEQYTVGAVRIESHVAEVGEAALLPFVRLQTGDVYNGDLVEKSTEALTREIGRLGYAFATVRPRGERDPGNHTVSLGFVVDEGSRVYIERINVRGNTRTRDYVVRREFDIGEGDPYNKVLIDRAERRLNSLGFFKRVKITTVAGSSPDRVVIDVDVEDQPTGSFSISGGYSTTDGFIAEAAVTETNFLGRGQFVKLAVQAGQNSRGVDFSFTEPYILDTRIAAGFDIFAKQSDNTIYSLYSSFVTGGTLRLGIPITDEFSISPHYSIYNTDISIPNNRNQPFNDCLAPIAGVTPFAGGTGTTLLSATNNCVTNGEASLAIKQARGSTLTNLVGVNFAYNTLDNAKIPTNGLYVDIRNDFGFDSNSETPGYSNLFVRNSGDLRYFRPVYDEIIGIVHVQGGNIASLDGKPLRITDMYQLGPTLVRGFAPSGLGPRDISDPANSRYNPLGATSYAGASLEVQFPIFGLPRELGLKGALFADAGTAFNYGGKTNFNQPGTNCVYVPNAANGFTQGTCVQVRDSDTIRSSVGASILWASPLGPIRFDYAYALTKDRFDVTQAFRFSGGTSF